MPRSRPSCARAAFATARRAPWPPPGAGCRAQAQPAPPPAAAARPVPSCRRQTCAAGCVRRSCEPLRLPPLQRLGRLSAQRRGMLASAEVLAVTWRVAAAGRGGSQPRGRAWLALCHMWGRTGLSSWAPAAQSRALTARPRTVCVQVQWLPAVGPAGENLVGPPTDPRLAAWWRGPCVAGAIDAFAPAARNVGRPLRLPVAEAGRGARGGAAVSGKLEAGALKARVRAHRLQSSIRSTGRARSGGVAAAAVDAHWPATHLPTLPSCARLLQLLARAGFLRA